MKKFLVSLMAAFALLFVSACGGSDSSEGQSGSTEKVGEDKGTELTKDNFADEIMKAQLDAGTAHLVMTMTMGGQEITMDGDMSVAEKPADTAMSLTMDGEALGAGDTDLEMRLVDQVMYMKMGQATGDKFARIDLTDESNPMGAQFSEMMEQSNPATQVEAMGESIESFEDGGDGGEIDGVSTTKYRITLNAAKMYEAQGTDPSAMAGLPETIEYVMYVGDDNLPRRLEAEVMGATAVNEWTKWGEDVDISAPSDDEITDQNPFAGMGG
ncbi:hypothetical protein D9V41_04945 [Aeromicrobium phragmitis]|uniref:LppX_LprAFG lipoprotein n=1 Tax=Aeromicrobium phragmitis TaxID=2478914 RepID=A0A3L8PNQ9_9ACTN|nr:hypothetical protein [Aeromicrobium phragmitis]RLV56429.1 hypothetical protein D9V41_04945 [Aeromicrobium phragmitis]